MANAATIVICGRLGQDPTTRYLPSGAMSVQFSVAVSTKRGGDERTAWYRVSAFGKLAEVCDRLASDGALIKGREVYVAGRLDPREYQGNDGTTRTSLDVNANEIQLIGPRADVVADNTGEAPF